MAFVFKNEKLGLVDAEVKMPLVTPGVNVLKETTKDVKLGEEAGSAIENRPGSSIIGEEGEVEVRIIVIEVIYIDGEEERREHTPLRDTR